MACLLVNGNETLGMWTIHPTLPSPCDTESDPHWGWFWDWNRDCKTARLGSPHSA